LYLKKKKKKKGGEKKRGTNMLQTIKRNQVSVFIMFVPTCCHDSRRAGTCHSKRLELEEK